MFDSRTSAILNPYEINKTTTNYETWKNMLIVNINEWDWYQDKILD